MQLAAFEPKGLSGGIMHGLAAAMDLQPALDQDKDVNTVKIMRVRLYFAVRLTSRSAINTLRLSRFQCAGGVTAVISRMVTECIFVPSFIIVMSIPLVLYIRMGSAPHTLQRRAVCPGLIFTPAGDLPYALT